MRSGKPTPPISHFPQILPRSLPDLRAKIKCPMRRKSKITRYKKIKTKFIRISYDYFLYKISSASSTSISSASDASSSVSPFISFSAFSLFVFLHLAPPANGQQQQPNNINIGCNNNKDDDDVDHLRDLFILYVFRHAIENIYLK